MEPATHIEALARESERFAQAVQAGSLELPVPSCPGWSLGDLVWHLAGVQWVWNEVVRTRATTRDEIGQPEDRPDDGLLPWFDDVSAQLVGALRAADPATRLWSWAGGEQDVAWVARRQAHEAAVHRWDAERASGTPQPIAPDLAADGIDEFLAWMIGPDDLNAFSGSVTVRLAPMDGGVERLVRVRDGRIDPSAEAAGADVTVRGSASDLLLMLWRRVDPDAVTVDGDRDALDRFLSLADLT